MVAANDLVDGAVKSKGVRQREYRPPGGARGTESYEGRPSAARGPRRDRLNHIELQELEDLWGMHDASMGVRSSHGAVQARLLRAPPRDDIRALVLAELERKGGRAPEGAIVKIVVADHGHATTYEVKRAVKMLEVYGKIERVRIEAPASAKAEADEKRVRPRGVGTDVENMRMLLPADRLTEAQRQWTGFELRVKAEEEGSPKVVRLTAEERARERWRRQDEALEASLHELYCHDDSDGYASADREDNLSTRSRTGIDRASAAMALLSQRHRRVIRSYYLDSKGSLVAAGEFTDFAVAACISIGAPTTATAIRRLASNEKWLAEFTLAAEALVAEASMAYKAARHPKRLREEPTRETQDVGVDQGSRQDGFDTWDSDQTPHAPGA